MKLNNDMNLTRPNNTSTNAKALFDTILNHLSFITIVNMLIATVAIVADFNTFISECIEQWLQLFSMKPIYVKIVASNKKLKTLSYILFININNIFMKNI